MVLSCKACRLDPATKQKIQSHARKTKEITPTECQTRSNLAGIWIWSLRHNKRRSEVALFPLFFIYVVLVMWREDKNTVPVSPWVIWWKRTLKGEHMKLSPQPACEKRHLLSFVDLEQSSQRLGHDIIIIVHLTAAHSSQNCSLLLTLDLI